MTSDLMTRDYERLLLEPTQSYARPVAAPIYAGTTQNAFVFIVEDDVAMREGLVDLLESVGLQSQAFSSPTELLNMELPDLASCFVLDIRMPGISGLDFQARLVAAGVRIPIIFMTGHADVPMAVRAMKAGAVDFLTKPFREQEMLDAVTRAIELDGMRLDSNRRAIETFTRFQTLSEREREVMDLVTAGLMNKQVAGRIGVVESTVKIYRAQVMRRMGAQSLADLVRMAELLRSAPAPTTSLRAILDRPK